VGCAGALGVEPGRSPMPEQPASRKRDARAASHGDDARAGRDLQACHAANIWAGSPRDDGASCRRLSTPAIGIFAAIR
jgi:hypothetical protein